MWPFFVSSVVLGFLDQLQIFWQLYLIELLGLLTGLGLLELWHLIYPRLLTGFGMLVFFTNLSLMEFQVTYFALCLLFSVIDGLEWFWMESLHKNISPGSILGPTLFILYINDLSDNVIVIYADDTTLYSKCDGVFDLWQQLELALSDLQDIVDCSRKWLVVFKAGKN